MRQAALNLDRLPPNVLLEDRHYLGPSRRASFVHQDEHGLMVFAAPSARHLPSDWLELVRWCLTGGPNAGSRQWKAAKQGLEASSATTVVSYSDPSVGHTGALYRACNWLWAPTWHRLRPPPTGNGSWTYAKGAQAVKDRWIAVLKPDPRRASLLMIQDVGIRLKMPWAEYREPHWKRGRPNLSTGGGDYKRFIAEHSSEPAAPPVTERRAP